MQCLISNGCVKILFICYTYQEQSKVYKQHPWNGITFEKCHKWIDVDFRKIRKQISSNLDYGWPIKMWYKIWLQIKRGKANCSSFEQTWPRPSLATMVSLPWSPLSVGQATVIFFYICFWCWRVGPTLYFWIETCFPQILYPMNSTKKFIKNTNNS
jgi:hypothetical protein